ncbi:MAG: TonB-dependent receptor [Myxococcales bacterium]|nr:TonB-dependent receptor [Myxococcales bacterium]
MIWGKSGVAGKRRSFPWFVGVHTGALSVLLWIFCLHHVRAHPPGTADLIGCLTQNGNNIALEGVHVTVDELPQIVLTDKDGCFLVPQVPEGRRRVKLLGKDILPLQLDVDVRDGADPISVEIKRLDDEDFRVVIAGHASNAQFASTTSLTARDVQSVPVRTAEDVLGIVPGLTLIQHGSEGKGQQFFLRGFDAVHGTDLAITIDGVPINEWSNIHGQGYIDLTMLPPEVIRTVEVTKGPFSLDQGAFVMAGSAAYRLGVPVADLGWRVQWTSGTTNRHRIFLGYSPEHGTGDSFLVADATFDSGYGENREVLRTSVAGRSVFFDSETYGKLDLTLLVGVSRFELPGAVRADDVESGKIDFHDSYDDWWHGSSARTIVSLSHTFENDEISTYSTVFSGFRDLDVVENFTGFLIEPDLGDARQQNQRAWSFGMSTRVDWAARPWMDVQALAGVSGDVIRQRQHNVETSGLVWSTAQNNDIVQLHPFLGLGLSFDPVSELRIDVGARLDLVWVSLADHLSGAENTGDPLWVVSPRFSINWRAAPELLITFAYGRGFRPPEARAFAKIRQKPTTIDEEQVPDTGPAMTVSDAVELGFLLQPAAEVLIRASGFGTWIGNESIFDHVSGLNLSYNATRRVGAEVGIDVFPWPWLKLSGDLTYVNARFVESNNPVPLAPWLVSGAHALFTHESGWSAGFHFLSIAPRDLPHGATGAALYELQGTVGWRWNWLRLSVAVENLLNKRQREGEYHFASFWDRDGEPSQLPVLQIISGAPFNARFSVGIHF